MYIAEQYEQVSYTYNGTLYNISHNYVVWYKTSVTKHSFAPSNRALIYMYRWNFYMNITSGAYNTAAQEWWYIQGATQYDTPAYLYIFHWSYTSAGGIQENFDYISIPSTPSTKSGPWNFYWKMYVQYKYTGSISNYYYRISQYGYQYYDILYQEYQYIPAIEYTKLQYRYSELD